MIKVQVINKDKYIHASYNDNTYILKMIFLNSCFNVEVGDTIYLDDALFDEIANNLIYFKLLVDVGRKTDNKDVIVIVHNDEKFYLKRLYG